MTCQFGCSQGACLGDPCSGINCVQPPSSYCLDPNTARSFTSPGTCSGGGCTYATRDTSCPFGCASGACRADPCLGVSCTTPPPSTCANASTARVFTSVGTCGGNGTCSYAPVDVPCTSGCSNGACNGPVCGSGQCNQPPAATCVNANLLRTSARLGTCQSQTCSYQAIDITCSLGCFNGACVSGSWRRERAPTTPLVAAQLLIDASGAPHVYGCSGADIEHRWRDDYGWKTEKVDLGIVNGDSNCHVSMAFSPNGELLGAWYDGFNQDLRFGRRVNGSWQLELVRNSGSVGAGASLIIDGAGNPVVAARDGTSAAVFRKGVGGWTSEIASPTVTGNVFALALSPAGVLHLAGGSGPAFVAVKGPAGWSVTSLGTVARIERGALGFDPAGRLHVAYIDQSEYVVRQGLSADSVESVGVGGNFRVTAARQFVSRFNRQLRNGAWQFTPASPSSGTGEATLDWAPHANAAGMAYLFNDLSVVYGPTGACQPSCGASTCGDDGCGGTCGSCASGLSCSSLGTCTAWREAPLLGRPRESTAFERSPTGALHLFVATAYNASGHRIVTDNGGPVVSPSPVFEQVTFDADGQPATVSMGASNTLLLSTFTIDGGWRTTPSGGSFANRVWNPRLANLQGALEVMKLYDSTPSGETIKRQALVHETFGADGGVASETVFNTTSKIYGGLAIAAASDTAHVFWSSRPQTGATTTWSVNSATLRAGVWSAESVIWSAVSSTVDVKARVDSTGAVHLFVEPYPSGGSLNISGGQWGRLVNGAWVFETLPTYSDLVLGPQRTPVLLLRPTTATGAPQIIRRAGVGQWTREDVPVTSQAWGSPVAFSPLSPRGSMAIEPDGTSVSPFRTGGPSSCSRADAATQFRGATRRSSSASCGTRRRPSRGSSSA